MNRLRPIAIAALLSIPATAWAQRPEEILKAHSKITEKSGASTAADFIDWNFYDAAGWRAINKGYYDVAEKEFRAAIKAAKRPHIDDPRLLARSYADFAWAIQLQGRYAEAEPLARWALTTREGLLEPGSPGIIQSLNQLASIQYEMGRFEEAEPLLKRAIEGQAKLTKPNAKEYARTHTLLGLVLVAQRRYAEAETYFSQALKLRERSQGTTHRETGDALNNLAWTYLPQGKEAEARPLFERALRIFEPTLGTTDPSVAHVLDGLGQVEVKAGKNSEAEAHYLRAIEIWDEREPKGNGSVVEVLKHYADFLEKQGRAADLVKIRARIAPIRAKVTLDDRKAGRWYRRPEVSPPVDPNQGRRI